MDEPCGAACAPERRRDEGGGGGGCGNSPSCGAAGRDEDGGAAASGAGCILHWTWRPRRHDPWRAPALLALLAVLLVSPSKIDGQPLREQRYCFHAGDGVCDEGPHAEAPCAVGADEYDCRRRKGFVAATPHGAGWQPGRVVDGDDDRWPTTWRSAEAGEQSVEVELDQPRCLATLRVAWSGAYSARDYVILGSRDGATWFTLVAASNVADPYGDRVDPWQLETEVQGDGSVLGTAGRVRFLRLDATVGHDSYYELRSVSWTEDSSLCPECSAAGSCGTCIAQGCAWCDEPLGAACLADEAGSCSASSLHTGAWRTPETLQRRTCAGGCEGDACGPGEEVASYLSPPLFPVPDALDPANTKRDSVPFECAEFDVALQPENAVASSTLNSNYPASKAFDGQTSETGYANVWMSDQGCEVMAGAVCVTMVPQWISYDFGTPQAICTYALRSRAVALWMSPQSWDFQGSNDGEHWITITQVRGEPEWSAIERREYDTGLAVFRWFRIYITEVYGANIRSELQAALQEVDMMPPLNECITDPWEFETAEPTSTTDRECSTVIECTPYEYETLAPTELTNRECDSLQLCSDTQYESVPATDNTDRVCTDLRICIDGEYVEPSGEMLWSNTGCSTVSTDCSTGSIEDCCYYVTDRVCTGLPTVEEGTWGVSYVRSDAIRLEWPEPIREGYRYVGFMILLDGIDAASLDPANDFSESLELEQTIVGLHPTTTYSIILKTVWEFFGPSLPSEAIFQTTGPAVSPVAQGTALYNDALSLEWGEPASQFGITGWVFYSRLSPYIILDGYDCSGTAVSPPVTVTGSVCVAAAPGIVTGNNQLPTTPATAAEVLCAAVTITNDDDVDQAACEAVTTIVASGTGEAVETAACSFIAGPDKVLGIVPKCTEACDALDNCCGFRYDESKSPLECILVTDCTGECADGCIGNFYQKTDASRALAVDIVHWHESNDYTAVAQMDALVQGLSPGRTYDFWVVPRIYYAGGATCVEAAQVSVAEDLAACAAVSGSDLETADACEAVLTASTDDDPETKACTYNTIIESLPVGGCDSVMPTFQQMTVPAGTTYVSKVN